MAEPGGPAAAAVDGSSPAERASPSAYATYDRGCASSDDGGGSKAGGSMPAAAAAPGDAADSTESDVNKAGHTTSQEAEAEANLTLLSITHHETDPELRAAIDGLLGMGGASARSAAEHALPDSTLLERLLGPQGEPGGTGDRCESWRVPPVPTGAAQAASSRQQAAGAWGGATAAAEQERDGNAGAKMYQRQAARVQDNQRRWVRVCCHRCCCPRCCCWCCWCEGPGALW